MHPPSHSFGRPKLSFWHVTWLWLAEPVVLLACSGICSRTKPRAGDRPATSTQQQAHSAGGLAGTISPLPTTQSSSESHVRQGTCLPQVGLVRD